MALTTPNILSPLETGTPVPSRPSDNTTHHDTCTTSAEWPCDMVSPGSSSRQQSESQAISEICRGTSGRTEPRAHSGSYRFWHYKGAEHDGPRSTAPSASLPLHTAQDQALYEVLLQEWVHTHHRNCCYEQLRCLICLSTNFGQPLPLLGRQLL